MPSFRLCFLYGNYYPITIDEPVISLETLRKEIQNRLPKYREIKDYTCTVSGKPPHRLDLNNEEEFNKYRLLITDGSYVWLKFLF